jgi:hypothetical protein
VLAQDGRWVPITDTMEDEKDIVFPGIRRAATRDVKALGIHYILLNEGDLVYEDLIKFPTYWGLTELATANGTHFYRID